MAVDDFDADLADVTEDGYDTNLDAFGPGSGRGEDVGYRGTGEGIYDAGSDSYYMPSRSNIINSDNYDVGFAMNDQLSRGLSGDVFDPAKVQQYNQIAAGFSSQPLNISNQQIMNNSAMLREQGKGLEDIRVDFVKELGSKEGNAAFGNFLSGAFNVSKMGPYSDPMKTSDIGAFGVGLSSLMGDKTANYPMNNYDLVDLAMKQGNFALSGRDPSEFGSLGGIANQFGRDVSAGAKQVTNQLLSLADGAMSYLSNQGKAGDTVENIVAEQRGKEIAQLEKERLEQGLNKDFKPITFPSIERTNVLDNSFMDRDASLATNAEGVDSLNRPSIAQLAEDRKKQNALNSVFDMLNKDTQNIEIAAGTNAGKTLNTALPKPRDLNAFTSPGYLQSSVNPIIKENPMQGPPRPSEKAPPGFVDIVMREDQNPVFAGTNMSIFGGRDPSAKAYTPLTEAEALASDFTGFTLEPFSPMFEKTYDPRDYTASGVLTGVNLPAAEFRVGKSEPEKVKRVAISSLPPIAQGINALRSDFDISPRVPISMQTIIDGARAVERGDFSQQEMADFLGGFGRYAK